jgi:hypothetical protein
MSLKTLSIFRAHLLGDQFFRFDYILAHLPSHINKIVLRYEFPQNSSAHINTIADYNSTELKAITNTDCIKMSLVYNKNLYHNSLIYYLNIFLQKNLKNF